MLGYPVSAQSANTERPVRRGPHSLTLGSSIGLLSGESEKIVYRGAKDKLSQLLWKMEPLFYVGIDINYEWRRPENRLGFFANALFKRGFFSSESSIMEDRDWTHSDYPDFLTLYSVHNNETEDALFLDAGIGVSFDIFDKCLLKTYITYNFMHFSWRAYGGSFLYPPANGGHWYYPSSINVITYEQDWHILSPAVAFYGEINRYFDIELFLESSPLIWSFGEDHHLLRNLVITDDLTGGFFLEQGLLFSFRQNNFSLSFCISFKNIVGNRGSSKYEDNNKGETRIHQNIGGAGYSAFDIGIMARFNILEY
jgi:outer membrane protease